MWESDLLSRKENTMNIWGITSTHGSQSVNGVKGVESSKASDTVANSGISDVQDTVALSADAVQAAGAASDIRLDKVNSIRAAIADGSYETPEKLDAALDRLLDRLS